MANDRNRGLLYNLGNLAFKTRSYTPVPLGLFMIWQAQVVWPGVWVGLGLMTLGEFIRLAALRSSGKATRTRNVGASRLVTWGLYAYTRNPLYIGNLLLWIGAVIFSGGPYLNWLLGLIILLFMIQYVLIIGLEESTLLDLFGDEYEDFKANVPRIIPAFRRTELAIAYSSKTPERGLHSWGYAFQSEKSTFIAVTSILILATLATIY